MFIETNVFDFFGHLRYEKDMKRLLFLTIGIFLIFTASAWADTPQLLISEVAWMGTDNDSGDEWIELINTSDEDLTINGWKLVWGDVEVLLRVQIPAQSYFMLERTDDDSLRGIPANQIYRGSLSNRGEAIHLYDAQGNLIDSANGDGGPWPAGNNRSKSTMQRHVTESPEQDLHWITAPATPGRENRGLDIQDTNAFSEIGDQNMLLLMLTMIVVAGLVFWWFNR